MPPPRPRSLKRAGSVLIMHDLYPDVLVMSGLLKPQSLAAKAMRGLNALMFRALSAVVVIGRDTEKLLMQYGEMMRAKDAFHPELGNACLPPFVRSLPDNPYRKSHPARFVVGLSGNLGFTHDPVIVFEAARLLRDRSGYPFPAVRLGHRLRPHQADAVGSRPAKRDLRRSRG